MDTSWQNAKSIDIPEEALIQTLDNEKALGNKFSITKQSPFVLVGLAGLTAVCGIGAYKWKTMKKTMRPSMYLIQLRVAAQGTVLACITIGMVYQMYTDFVLKKKD
ncbi:HIG1 domain family member 1C [Anthophora quadrimaculata]